MRLAAVLLLWIAAAGAAMAQAPAPTDNVTVTGTKSREVITRFVESFTAPARLTGKLGRWDIGVCPMVVGLKPEFGKFIVQRIQEMAGQAGAPVNTDPRCRPNIHIAFTTTPQALLTNIRKTRPYLLGYADSEANKDRLAKVAFPIQAWYATQTRDVRGKATFDSPKVTGVGDELRIPLPNYTGAGVSYMMLPNALGAREVTGGKLGDGARTVFYNVIIAADPNALLEQEMGTVADHIAMLALAQTEALKDCPPLPSILNLFTPGCAARPVGMTVADAGYLRGLYSMDAQAILKVQRDQMVHKIGQSLEGR